MVCKQLCSDDLSNHTFSRNTDHFSFSDRIRSVFGKGRGDSPESTDHMAVDPRATSENQSDWKSTTDHMDVDPRAASENQSDWKSTTYATTRLAINLVKESSDVFPPLKSVAGGLSAILNHCEVRSMTPRLCRPRCLQLSQQTIACRQTIESLIPRVEGLAESLSTPVPEGEVKEEGRRTILKR